MNIVDVTYNFKPAAFLFLAIPLFIILAFLFYQYRNSIIARYASIKRIDTLLVAQNSFDYCLRTAAFCVAWFLLCLALMQPQGNPHYPPNISKTESIDNKQLMPHEVIFFIDSSASMSVPDARLGMTRLDSAKDVADQIIGGLQGQSASLYSFTSDVSKLSPPSMDYLFMRMMLQNMGINDADMTGTDIKAALKYFKEQYQTTPSLIKSLVILSDGEDNQFQELKASERDNYLKELAAELGSPDKIKLNVFTVGIGTTKGGEVPNVEFNGSKVISKLDETLLKNMTNQNFLKYYSANDYAAADIAQDILKNVLSADQYQQTVGDAGDINQRLIYDLYYQYPLTLGLIILTMLFFWRKTSVLKCVAFLFIFFTVNVNAKDDLLLKAGNFYQAEDEKEAITIYNQMLKNDLSPWERIVVTYNLSLAHSLKNDFKGLERAIDTLQKIPLNQNSSPLLNFRLLNNLAVLNFRQGLLTFQDEDVKKVSLDEYYKAIYHLKNATRFSESAKQKKCDLLKAIGLYTCDPDPDLDYIHSKSLTEIAGLQKRSRSYLIEQSTIKESVLWLLTALNLLEQDVDFLETTKMKESLQKQYVEYFLVHALSWQPLWESSKKKSKDSDLFANGEISFNSFLKNLENKDFETAKDKLTASKNALNAYLKSLFENDSFYLVLSQIENQFSLLSLEDPMEINSLVFLQQALTDMVVSEKYQSLKLGIDTIKNNIEQSLSKWQNNLDIMGKIYFDEAHAQLNRILLTLHKDVSSDPNLILNAAIDEQRHALSQTRYLSQLTVNLDDRNYQSAYLFAKSSQSYISSYANYFYDAAFARQTRLFNEDLVENVKKERCQYHPWNEVFPVFQKGMDLANNISNEFKSKNLDLSEVMINQNRVIDIWKDAFEKMQEQNRIKGGCRATTDFKNSDSLKNQSFENTAQLIQQMNQQDKPVNPVKAPLKEGLRSW